MPEQDGLNPADQELEAALRSLAPAAARIDPVAAAFVAGQLAMRRQLRRWQAATAAMLLVSAGAWLTLLQQSRTATNFADTAAQPSEVAKAIQPPAAQSLWMLREAMWKNGVDGLPAVDTPSVTPVRANELFSNQRGES